MFNKTHVYFVFVFSFFLHGCVTPTGRYKQLAGLGENSAISDPKQAQASVHDENLNVLSLSADFLSEDKISEITKSFLGGEYSPEKRYERRLEEIKKIESSN